LHQSFKENQNGDNPEESGKESLYKKWDSQLNWYFISKLLAFNY
jgi:hypothetical protein